MMRYAYAPSAGAPPALFYRYVLMKDYGIPWEQTGEPPDMVEVGQITQMVSIWHEAQEIKRSVKSK